MHILVLQRVAATELSMEVSLVVRDRCQHIGDLIVHDHGFGIAVLEGDARLFTKRHRPITVKRAARINTDSQ